MASLARAGSHARRASRIAACSGSDFLGVVAQGSHQRGADGRHDRQQELVLGRPVWKLQVGGNERLHAALGACHALIGGADPGEILRAGAHPVASAAAWGSTMRRTPISCVIVAPESSSPRCQSNRVPSSWFHSLHGRTTVPRRCRAATSPLAESACNASRRTGRLTA